ncbi:hypothetical protein [Leptospira mayottensis]|nr:hypothetical protein [Leptospira mayottensis]
MQTSGSVYFDAGFSMIGRESLFSLDSLGVSLKDRNLEILGWTKII